METDKERYLAICHFERTNDLFTFDGFWNRTLSDWVKQGAPKQIFDGGFRANYFGYGSNYWLTEIHSGLEFSRGQVLDLGSGIRIGNWGTVPIEPSYQPKIISEDDRTATIINGGGQKVRMFKGHTGKMPMYLEYPVNNRDSWKEYKKRLNPDNPNRWPEDWKAYAERVNKIGQEMPITLQVGSLFGFLRESTGTEALLFMFYDDPGLIEDMMDTILDMEMVIVKRVLRDIKINQAAYWEDMCYRAGPMISPGMFKKFMVPRYKKLNEYLRSNGVDIILVDSDGDITKLISLWLEAGVNLFAPLEVMSGMDAVALRKQYGKNILLQGNIDKRELAKDKEAIRKEVLSKVPYLLSQGGYFPVVDHNVPPDISFENYCYYINTLREIAGLHKLSF